MIDSGDQDTEETLAILSMQKGYAERAFDAHARAYNAAKGNAQVSQVSKDEVLGKLKSLYQFRFGSDLSKFDTYLAQVGTASFVDPATPITPVKDAVPLAEPKPDPKSTTKPKTTKAPSQKPHRKAH